MGAKLVAEEGILKGLVLSFDEGDQWIIGRDPDGCQLLVEDPAASRKHLICRVTPEGILVENLSSTNPTQVNDEDVAKPRILQNGDAVRIGSGMFRYYAASTAQVIPEQPSVQGEENSTPEEEQQQTNGIKVPQLTGEEAAQPEESPKAEEEQQPANGVKVPQLIEEASEPEESQTPEEEQQETNEKKVPQATEEEASQPSEEEEVRQDEVTPSLDEEAAPSTANSEPQQKPIQEPISGGEEPPQDEPMSDQAVSPKPEQEFLNPDIDQPQHAASESQESIKDEDGEPSRDSIFEENNGQERHDLLAEINFDMVDTGRWLLKIVGGPNNGAEFSMQHGSSYVIGTDPNSCDIILHDTSVSRQHARITINDDETITLEDLNSRNGTIVDGEPLHGRRQLDTNLMVTMGTTSFIVFDREGEMQTIIAPLLPSIVKVLQKEEPPQSEGEAKTQNLEGNDAPIPLAQELAPAEKAQTAIGAFILLGIIIGLFVIVGIGTTMLFKGDPIQVAEQVDTSKVLSEALSPFPSVKWSYNKATGRLLLVGHVLTATDKNQLLYNLGGFKFIKHVDDSGIVIDEYVWREINQILEKNPQWKGITVFSPSPGHFVVSGSLQTKAQADKFNDFLSSNFPYLDLLDKRVVVEEEVMNTVNTTLQNLGIKNIVVQVNGGDLTLTGGVPQAKQKDYEAALAEFRQIQGIRSVRNLATAQAPESSIINITSKYEVTGYSQSGTNVNVVINGRILSVGDALDGMILTAIKSNSIFLEKEGVKYRIDFSR